MKDSGKIRGIYLPKVLDGIIEETRVKLGMNRSRFIQYCIMRTLEHLGVISVKVHEVTKGESLGMVVTREGNHPNQPKGGEKENAIWKN